MIFQIIAEVGVDRIRRSKHTPSYSTKILHLDIKSSSFDNSFNYCSVVGVLNYLEKGSRTYTAYAVHQCAYGTSSLLVNLDIRRM